VKQQKKKHLSGSESRISGFEMMPVENATMLVHLLFFAGGLVTLLFFLANDQVSLWAR